MYFEPPNSLIITCTEKIGGIMEKLRASGLNQGEYIKHLDPNRGHRSREELDYLNRSEKKTFRHREIGDNVVGFAKSSQEVELVIAYARRYPCALMTTVLKKFPSINWQPDL
jgi:hypothetical protein